MLSVLLFLAIGGVCIVAIVGIVFIVRKANTPKVTPDQAPLTSPSEEVDIKHQCGFCGRLYSKDLDACPNCNAPMRKP